MGAVGNRLAAVRHRGVGGVALVAGQHKGESVLVQPTAVLQHLAGQEDIGILDLVRIGAVGIGEIGLETRSVAGGIRAADCTRQCVAISRNRYSCYYIAGVVIEAGQFVRVNQSLRNFILVDAGLCEDDFAEIAKALLLRFTVSGCIGNRNLITVFALRLGCISYGGHLKGEFVAIHPIAALKDLADPQACTG